MIKRMSSQTFRILFPIWMMKRHNVMSIKNEGKTRRIKQLRDWSSVEKNRDDVFTKKMGKRTSIQTRSSTFIQEMMRVVFLNLFIIS